MSSSPRPTSLVTSARDGPSYARCWQANGPRSAAGRAHGPRSSLALADQVGRSGEPVVRQWLAAAYTRECLLDLVRMRMTDAAAVPAGGPLTQVALLGASAAHGRHGDQDPRCRRHAHRRCRRRHPGSSDSSSLPGLRPRWWYRRDPAQRRSRNVGWDYPANAHPIRGEHERPLHDHLGRHARGREPRGNTGSTWSPSTSTTSMRGGEVSQPVQGSR